MTMSIGDGMISMFEGVGMDKVVIKTITNGQAARMQKQKKIKKSAGGR